MRNSGLILKRRNLVFIVALMTVIGRRGQIQAQAKIRLGLSAVSAVPSPVWIAEEKGLFRKHGLETEIIITGQGASTGISALLSNDIQLVASAGDAFVASRLQGGDTVMLASLVNKGLQRIMARSDIKTPAELKGKRIGVTRIGAVSHSVSSDDVAALEDDCE